MARAFGPALALDPETGVPRLASQIVLPEPVMRALVRGTNLAELVCPPANDPFAPEDDEDEEGVDEAGDSDGDVVWAWIEEDDGDDEAPQEDPADMVAESLLSVILARKLKG